MGRESNVIDDRLNNIQRSPMKEGIEKVYLQTTETSSLLRDIVMARVPGVRENEYKSFIRLFGYLFNISKNKTDLDKDVVTKCRIWFNTPRSSSSTKNIMKGLKLYDEYVTELFVHKLLKYE